MSPPEPTAAVRGARLKGRLLLGFSLAAGVALTGWTGGWWGWPAGPDAWQPVSATTPAETQPHRRSGLVASPENRGLVLFGRYCDSCHTAGKETPLGNSLRSAQTKREFSTAAKIADKVRAGGFDMPAFPRDFLADDDLLAIAGYVLSLPADPR